MKALTTFLVLLIPRLLIPVSFTLCLVLAPISMLLDAPNWHRRLLDMWHDPI
jgi:hypothetical protein